MRRWLLATALIGAALLPLSRAAAEGPFTAARLQVLNKVTTRVSQIDVKPMAPVTVGTLDIQVRQCWKSGNEERPEQAALIEIEERPNPTSQSTNLFSGWMFASAPALSALEHPVYDVALIECRY